jgi:O-methyltransferase
MVRDVIGYDSFQGLPTPSVHDLDCWSAGEYCVTLSDVSRRVRAARRPWLRLVPGWFSETLIAGAEPAQVALANVDCDLYASACACLEFLEGRLIDGAFLLFDDWTHRMDKGETKAFVEFYDRVQDRYRFEHVASLGSGACHFRVWLK